MVAKCCVKENWGEILCINELRPGPGITLTLAFNLSFPVALSFALVLSFDVVLSFSLVLYFALVLSFSLALSFALALALAVAVAVAESCFRNDRHFFVFLKKCRFVRRTYRTFGYIIVRSPQDDVTHALMQSLADTMPLFLSLS